MSQSIAIRPIQKKDNQATAEMIRYVLIEQNAPKTGTAYEDKALDDLYETYKDERAVYYILTENDEIIGGAGIQALDDDDSICELQKMYFHPKARGRGLGQQMIEQCLRFAKNQGYKSCYIETLPSMKAAQKRYLRNGFEYIDYKLGQTGHHACTVWMLKEL
ncbi:GNAT family N-acetyltransferase [Flavobacterium sp. CS20]|uniref:GNAT family N-acetyltransferase n=1 Tax=Flavobacterium sp. CS20 TaxID=2775246 RepID=UPI001B39DEC8|nr:GNAT family N-acetyltransferase [Flavobacterium sp. CS20]QTY26523.1 GNAT family N-acetyltransferase [Flavobacterium sp. CS20]